MRLLFLAPFLALKSFWQYRHLVGQMLRREIEGRYRGTLMGLAWSFVSPLFMLIIYAFVFSTVFRSRWPQTPWPESKMAFSLVLFAGLSLFGLVQECITRAHSLVVTQPSYVKKVVFLLEILPWVQLGAALVHLFIALGLLLAGELLATGGLPWTVLLFPLLLLPLSLFLLGIMWFLSALGVYLRDIGQVTTVVVSGLMFISPIFYPVEGVPEHARWLIALNPLSYFIELGRDLLLWGRLPDWGTWLLACLAAGVVFTGGFLSFQKLRRGFADVI